MILSVNYIVKRDDGVCIVEIAKDTSDDIITLGSSMQRQLSVFVDTNTKQNTYCFVETFHDKGVDDHYYSYRSPPGSEGISGSSQVK